MRYTTNLFNTKTASVLIPVFFSEKGDVREEENIKRMNSFYEELKKSVFGYTGSESFPEGGRYFAKAQVTENTDKLSVRVVMRLRAGGKTVSSRILTHTWQDGVVVEKRVE